MYDNTLMMSTPTTLDTESLLENYDATIARRTNKPSSDLITLEQELRGEIVQRIEFSEFNQLQSAQAAREAEWDKNAPTDLSFRGNELGGEVGEALEVAVDLLLLGIASGRAQNLVKKIERSRIGMVGSESSPEALGKELADIVLCAQRVAFKAGIALWPAIVGKFNETSDKYGLKTKLFIGHEARS